MNVEITESSLAPPAAYAAIPSRVLVREVFDVVEDSSEAGGARLVLRTLDTPYVKDYDSPAISHPSRWAERFDVRHWGFLNARVGGRDVARAAIAWNSPGVDLLEDREDVAALWDIRVAADSQRQGVGSALFRATQRWARQRGALLLKVETQNINVATCEFYKRQGCVLGGVDRFAYPAFPDEIQLLWWLNLTGAD